MARTARQPTLADRIVGWLDPARGLRRHAARQLLTRAYEGAARTDGWVPRREGASANQDHAADARELRARSRALVQNVPYMAQGLRSLVANVVGTGIMPTWAGRNADVLNTAWRQWCDECDADGRLSMAGLQAAAYRAMQQDGEVFIRLRTRRREDGLRVPLQLQLLEADYLDGDKSAELKNGGRITAGIETDAIGRIVAYWLFDEHPGDATRLRMAASRRVDAARVIHLFTPERPGQARGFPRAAPVIARVRDLQLYEDAELNRKNLESRLSVLSSGSVDLLGADGGVEHSAFTARAGEVANLGALPSGAVMQVPLGNNLTVVQPQAMPGYVEYVKHQLHLIAAGFGVTYEMMTGDVTEVNFSSARVRMLDFRREAELEQWSILVPKLCDRICRAFEDAAVLGEVVRAASYEFYHSTPKWAYVDPAKDVKADLDEISGGLSSISEKLRQRGYNPDDVFRELADDVQKLRELGLFDALAVMRSKSVSQVAAAESVQDGAAAEK